MQGYDTWLNGQLEVNASVRYDRNNVFGGIPTIAPDYSPLWNGNLYEWTNDAVSKGYRGQIREEFQILTYVREGILTGPGGSKFGDSKFIVNCPPIQRLN